MIRAESSPGGQRTGPVVAWLLPAIVMAGVAAVATAVVATDARGAVAVCGAVATVAVAALAAEVARRGKALASLRAQAAERTEALQRRLGQQEAVTVQLARERLPEAVARLQEGEFAEDVLASMVGAGEGLSPEFHAAQQALMRSVVEAVQAEETLRDSAQRGVVNVARRVQAIVYRQATDLRTMEDRHGQKPEFFADLLRLDHGTALIGRLADSIAVLGGARPGRQWSKAVPVYSVLRGAMSRILDYQRVELHSVANVAVIGPAVEPLIHALAELLDNATRYSPPKARVHLTASEVHAGIAIEIEDGGVGLSEEARARAEQMLKEAQAGIDLNDLGEAPRLGLAVVGRLAQAYDFQVSLPPSAYGGVRAVLVVPQKLITTAPAEGRAHGIGASSGQRSAESAAQYGGAAHRDGTAQYGGSAHPSAPAPSVPLTRRPQLPATGPSLRGDEDDEAPALVERTANGLPQRRRRRPGPAARSGSGAPQAAADPGAHFQGGAFPAAPTPDAGPGPAAAAHAAPRPAADEPAPGMWMVDLQSGLSGGPRPAADRNTNDKSLDEGE
ncbi:sensor histidine kinase [Streptomyces sp. NPDC048639]|uniref:sensor histidine kinase n=1 Tax=Streptomyces sp. NPDC048639 TaxID=3365581 RepID=UPI0037202A20